MIWYCSPSEVPVMEIVRRLQKSTSIGDSTCTCTVDDTGTSTSSGINTGIGVGARDLDHCLTSWSSFETRYMYRITMNSRR